MWFIIEYLTGISSSRAASSDTGSDLHLDLATVHYHSGALQRKRKRKTLEVMSEAPTQKEVEMQRIDLLTSRTASEASLGSSMVTKAYPLDRPPPPGSSDGVKEVRRLGWIGLDCVRELGGRPME